MSGTTAVCLVLRYLSPGWHLVSADNGRVISHFQRITAFSVRFLLSRFCTVFMISSSEISVWFTIMNDQTNDLNQNDQCQILDTWAVWFLLLLPPPLPFHINFTGRQLLNDGQVHALCQYLFLKSTLTQSCQYDYFYFLHHHVLVMWSLWKKLGSVYLHLRF